jgi:uncharacterized C2H2 Zn-finger protein
MGTRCLTEFQEMYGFTPTIAETQTSTLTNVVAHPEVPANKNEREGKEAERKEEPQCQDVYEKEDAESQDYKTSTTALVRLLFPRKNYEQPTCRAHIGRPLKSSEGRFTCSTCAAWFPTLMSLVAHCRVHGWESLVCPACKTMFRYGAPFVKHLYKCKRFWLMIKCDGYESELRKIDVASDTLLALLSNKSKRDKNEAKAKANAKGNATTAADVDTSTITESKGPTEVVVEKKTHKRKRAPNDQSDGTRRTEEEGGTSATEDKLSTVAPSEIPAAPTAA